MGLKMNLPDKSFRRTVCVIPVEKVVKYRKNVIIVVFIVIIVIIMYTTTDNHQNEYKDQKYLSRDFILDSEDIFIKTTSRPKRLFRTHRNTVQVLSLNDNYVGNKSEERLLLSIRTFKGRTPIFVHPPSVDILSSYIQDHGAWEEWLLNQTGRYLLQHTGTVFIDVGCNIGVYTLFMAKLGVQVVAVDPVEVNVQLLVRSLREGKLQENVTVIRNAVSDEYTNILVDVPTDNIGGAHIIGDENQGRRSKTTAIVPTILLDDLIPFIKCDKVFLKMDVEGHELHVIEGGATLFEQKDVKCILMEWVHHKSTNTGQKIIDFMLRKGYLPYEDLDNERLHPESYYRWPENVFWLKR